MEDSALRAAVLYNTGPPDSFVLEDVPVPAITEDQALVRVEACGVSYRDVLERSGVYRRDVVFPLISGLEISGVVEQLGAAVRGLEPGDRVCTKAFSSCGHCRYCRSGRETTCRARRPVRGGYSEYAAINQDALVRTPADMPFEISCILGPGAGVALNAVRDTARTGIGDTVLVTGATGGVGLPSVQLAKLAGARVIALTRSEAKRELLREAGADVVIVMPSIVDLARTVRDMTDGEGADVVIDTVGSDIFDAAFDSLAPHGRYAMVGQLSSDEIHINPARIFFKRAQLLGVGSVSRKQLEDVIALAADGRLQPKIGKILPLSRIADAHRLVETSAFSGRILVCPSSR